MTVGLMSLLGPYAGALEGQPFMGSDPLEAMGINTGLGLDSLAQPGGKEGGGGGGGIDAPHGNKGWEQYAADYFAKKYGWRGKEFNAVDKIITPESGWNPNAANPTSSARGIPQAMMSVHFGQNWEHSPKAQRFLDNPETQIKWLGKYIKGRYGDPISALKYRSQHGTY